MTFYNKLKWVLGILMIFVLIIATNLIDKNNFVRVRDAVETIYEDRLVAKDIIFKMLTAVHQKEVALTAMDTTFFKTQNQQVNTELESLVSRFEQTKLTSEEARMFSGFKENVSSLLELEASWSATGYGSSNQMVDYIERLKGDLNNLSAIQLSEGSRQMSISKRAVETVELFTQIEIYILVFLAILIQIVVMYDPKKSS